MRRGVVLVLALAGALVASSPAAAGGPSMRLGAAEDIVKQETLVGAKAKLTLARLAGLDTIRVTAIWAPSQVEPNDKTRKEFTNLAAAAELAGVRVVVSVYHFGSRTTPLEEEHQKQFAAYTAALAFFFPSFRDIIVANEPNLNRFWMPQFGANGENVAAPAYLSLLAKTYDTVKAVKPKVTIWGGALAPRGVDRPNTGRDTHSPTKFIRDMGTAYRASGRTRPVMDGFAMHPYCDNSSQAPSACAHPNTSSIGIADYGKLVALLGAAFDGTAQRGSTLPILYDEFGVETVIPSAKVALYTGTEPATIKPVDEKTQGAYYREAIGMSFCQPNVRGILLFHVVDEPERPAWQSGVFYVDEKPKASLGAVRQAAAEARRGVIAKCPGLMLTPKATVARLAGATPRFRLTCDIDCTYALRLETAPGRKLVQTLRGRAVGGVARQIAFRRIVKPTGSYRVLATVAAPVNPGPPGVVAGRPFRLR